MFNRQEESGTPNVQQASGKAIPKSPSSAGISGESSVINAGLTIVGNLQSEADVVIGGTVEGDISSRSLTVSEGAMVTGTIQSSSVEVRGKVEGQVHAATVKVARSGHVNGDIYYESLSIDEGAVVEGQLRRSQSGGHANKSKVSTLTPVDADGKSKDRSSEVKVG